MKEIEKTSTELNWLKEEVSEELKNRIFKAVQPELEQNKKYSSSKSFNYNWVWSALAAFSFALVITIRSTDIINIHTPSTTFDDLALLTPEEFEVVENLDLIDGIDKIDLEQIRSEMKARGNKS